MDTFGKEPKCIQMCVRALENTLWFSISDRVNSVKRHALDPVVIATKVAQECMVQ